jgi:hypothetical protein
MLGMSARAGILTNLDVEPADFHAMESAPFANVTVASFTDPGEIQGEAVVQSASALTLSDYQATIDWGDGTAADTALLALNGTGGIDVIGAHTYMEEGNYKIIVSVQDVDESTGSTNFIAHVIDAPLTGAGLSLTAVEGAPSGGPVATFTDANPNSKTTDFTASIDWGDGTTTDAIITSDGSEFVVLGNHTYSTEGPYAINVSILDEGGSRASPGTTINVSDAALSASGTTFAAVEGAPFSELVATFTDANPLAVASDFSATINWGDGNISPGSVNASGGSFIVTGSHTYADEAAYGITVNITDIGGQATTSAGSTAQVGDAALAASGLTLPVTEGVSFTKVVATFTDANPSATVSEFSATINWGEEATSAGTIQFNPESGCFEVLGNYMYGDENSHAITVTISDTGGSTATAGSTVTVSDAALSAAGVTLSPVEGAGFNATVATFTDANPLAKVNDFIAEINWGDGSSNSVGVIAANEGSFGVTGSHTYTDEGTYSITVGIADAGGSTATAGSTARVADAPLSPIGRAITPIENASFVAVVAGFIDANPYANTNDFSASVDWGDGVTSSGTIIHEGVNGFAVMGSHTYTNQGMFLMNVKIADDGGFQTNVLSVANTSDATLVGFGTTFTAVAGVPFTNQVANCYDSDTSPEASTSYHCIINWGDGTTSSGTMADWGREGSYGVTGSHTYALAGSYQVLVTIDNTHTFASTTARSTAVVNERPANDVTSQFAIRVSRPRLNKRTGLYQQEVTVKNISKQPVGGPISLVLDNLSGGSSLSSSSVTLMNKDGTTLSPGAAPIGSPYKNVSLPRNNLFKGRSARSVVLFFKSPSAAITYDARVLAGTGAR